MSSREKYTPDAAVGANVWKDGDRWTLILVRELRHPPSKVWKALTEPAQLREWAPFDADRDLSSIGPVTLSTVGTPTPQVSATTVKRAEASRLLEYSWGGNDIRWELEPLGTGTRLTYGTISIAGSYRWARLAGIFASTYSIGSSRVILSAASSVARQ
jgi:uncharacterized protein YndB with AHSA1/START domain